MKPLTISDFSFTIKKPPSTAVAEPAKKPEVKEAKPPEPAIDNSKLTDEQAERFKGLLSVDPENAKDITVEEYIALAESVMTFKEETIEGYNRYKDDEELRGSKVQLELKIRFGGLDSSENAVSVFDHAVNDKSKGHPIYGAEALRIAERYKEASKELLDLDYLSDLQSDAMEYLKGINAKMIDESV
ncbi:hypothetical protein [Idiomarina sp.]|uniref:hypothetical protein n=1 Tax=Idiomarina sp. TaxID=1874361 RepID=UPI003A92C5EB